MDLFDMLLGALIFGKGGQEATYEKKTGYNLPIRGEYPQTKDVFKISYPSVEAPEGKIISHCEAYIYYQGTMEIGAITSNHVDLQISINIDADKKRVSITGEMSNEQWQNAQALGGIGAYDLVPYYCFFLVLQEEEKNG